MTLIDALKRLAELFPEKWELYCEWTFTIRLKNDHDVFLETEYYSTEDCDRILAEHGMEMWVEPSEYTCGHWTGFAGNDRDVYVEFCNSEFSTKRSATEATFLAALEYIIKQREAR